MFDDLPSDFSEEEDDSDAEDPTYEPEPTITSSFWFSPLQKKMGKTIMVMAEILLLPASGKKSKKMTALESSTILKFFDRTLEENIVFQTNLYAQQKQRVVTPITLQDLRGFLGINVVMKYHVLPSYTHYWSSEPDLGVEIVASTMTKSRFQALLSNLHVNNEANATENDKLWKLRPLIDRLNLNFGKLWHKEKEKGQLFCE
ncbi:PiggyBac transposable element-derived protein 2-like [Plakobranchus ocellatus]|uniref:PiggyBac transposable element-derived protein 2-like n=1 Tax=Plakobranchus ocellatus TaxID=259542 RepID=A0AAV4D8K9_9GAST|nr:PiggyBac transposable element-derived protein 2-like [Plakobranchus ocellatus]